MIYAPLGELVDVVSGGTPSRKNPAHFDGKIPWVKIGDMLQGTVTNTQENISEAGLANSSAKILPAGTLLVSIFATIGRTAVLGISAATNQAIAGLILKSDKVELGYLRHCLDAEVGTLIGQSRGIAQNNINLSILKRLPIALPTLEEQRRIAAILDQAEELRIKRRWALEQLEALTQSVFQAMFDPPMAIANNWPTVTLESVARQITDGEHQTPLRQSSGIKLLSARNVRNGRVDLSNVDYIDMSEYERISRRCKPQRDDVLISCSGSIGRVAVVDTDENFSLVRSVALVRPDPENLLAKFLEQQLLTPRLQRKMSQSANTSSQANLFQGPIRKLPIVLPPIELQGDFVVKASGIECLKEQHRAQLVELDALFASLQHCAFKGEL